MSGDTDSVKVKSRDEMRDGNKFNNSNKRKAKVDLDSILVDELGQFGWFQLRILILTMIASFFGASDKEYVFTTARINNRCLVPECEDASNAVFATPWLSNALPSSGGSFDSCHQFGNTTDTSFPNHSCPAYLFDTSVTLTCTEHVYENQDTVVYDFDLACNEWLRTLIGFSRIFGNFFGIPFYGFVSDRWGRRIAITLTAFNSAWIGLSRYWANSYVLFTITQFLEGLLGPNVATTCYVLVIESVGPKYRTITSCLLLTCSGLGHAFIGVVAWAIPNWRRYTLVIFTPQLITISYFWILAESVRWYLSKGRYEDTENALKEIARINKKTLSENTLQLLRDTAKEDQKRKAVEHNEKAHEPWLPVLLFRHKPILIRCTILSFCWITETMVYHGLSIMSVNISGNKYINYIAVSAVEIPGYWIAALLMISVGRKTMMMGGFWLCAASQAAYIFIPSGYNVLSLVIYLLGKCSVAIVATTIIVYTAEVFPTKYRHRLFAFTSMMGRFGSISAPLMPAISAATFDEMPFAMFGCFALVAGLLILLTPETLGAKLPDSMQEADKLDRKEQDA